MLIIKPYGRSHTEFESEGKLRRKIRLDKDIGTAHDEPVDVGRFTKTHPELVIAQWISAIDKIAAKPRGNDEPTLEQRAFRQRLGEAALELLTGEGFLGPSNRTGELERLWWSKIHPYRKEGTDKGKGRERGRWYKRFAGEAEPADANAAAIAGKIREHLHEREYRIHPGRPDRSRGRITARAASIVQSAPPHLPDEGRCWPPQDEKDYEKAGNVAADIRARAEKLEKEARGRNRFSVRDAAPVLYEQYGRLFRDGNGKALRVPEARKEYPGMFALHCAVKDAYARILENHRPVEEGRRKSVARVLPADMGTLFRLVEAKAKNRDLNALVRMGKLIHYQAAPSPGQDAPSNVVDDWRPDVTHSRYRTSERQSEIKRTEAFVRVWRNTIALAARTLKHWADPQNDKDIRDVLGNKEIRKATGERFDASAYAAKLPLLFGDRKDLFESEDEAFGKSVLRLALNGWAKLRHSSFHFKGLGEFARALEYEHATADEDAVAAARALTKRDVEERWERLIQGLRAVHVEHYFDQARLDALVEAVAAGEPSQSPLPRFRRVLDRVEKAWRRKPHVLRLPPPSNRAELEKPGKRGLRCRYSVTKTLYEGAFRGWLEKQTAATLNGWIRRAVERATKAARSINNDEYAVARTAKLVHLGDGKGIAHFVDQLSARTATELRVQRGYNSDADKARKQSKYLDDLRCDVVGQAFDAYLDDAGLTWVLDDLDDALPEEKRSRLDAVPTVAPDSSLKDTKDWEAILYFLVHLVPVDVVNRLRHQLHKWSILEPSVSGDSTDSHGKTPESGDARSLARILDLHIEMHDAKFEGGEGMAGAQALKGLFEPEGTFDRVCPTQTDEDRRRYVPWRGLREILRFGCLAPLMPVFEKYPVKADNVDKLDEWEKAEDGVSRIAGRQAERERLHDRWARKKRFSTRDKANYREALAHVVEHRHLAAHVRLNNHARLHNLLMGVLGRLIDYARLWERDLYFTTLALMARQGKGPKEVFRERGAGYLTEGRVVEALRNRDKSSDDAKAVFEELERLFGTGFLDGRNGGVVSVRNDLAHFEMLQGRKTSLNLTEAVNDTRRLMAYDRKLENAVSQSVIEMLARENLDLTWDMEGHRLVNARVKARRATHLKDKRIEEDLHGRQFVGMTAELFGGKPLPSNDAVLSVNADEPASTRARDRKPKGGITQRNQKANRGSEQRR